MSFRPNFFSSFLRSSPSPFQFQPLSRQFHTPFGKAQSQFGSRVLSLSRPNPQISFRFSLLFPLAIGTTYATYHTFSSSPVKCESFGSTLNSTFSTRPTPEIGGGNPPQSSLSGYQLGFGAVCGVCAGIFVKKGLKALAFLLGGAFVLMQYLSSKRFISVDWGKVAGSYDSTFGTKGPKGEVRAPTVGGVWEWFVDFVTANFQRKWMFCHL